VKKKKKHPLPTLSSRYFDVGTQTEPVAIHSTSAVYEPPKPRFTFGEISDEDDDDDDGEDNDVLSREMQGRSVGRMPAL